MTIHLIVVIMIIAANLVISYKGFREVSFLDKYKFEVDAVMIHKEYIRLISSRFLHTNWMHLLFNMFTFYSFSASLSSAMGIGPFLLIYFGSLVGGNLLALFIHREHGDYTAVGSSGAVCGVIFASIAMFPGIEVGLFFLPVSFPSWVFGMIFMAISVYGILSKRDHIGHEAHLGGTLSGMVIALVFHPQMLLMNYIPILVILLPTLIFILIIIYKPHFLITGSVSQSPPNNYYDIDHLYNEKRANRQKEIDLILEKISRKGMGSLSKLEKEKLDEYSKH